MNLQTAIDLTFEGDTKKEILTFCMENEIELHTKFYQDIHFIDSEIDNEDMARIQDNLDCTEYIQSENGVKIYLDYTLFPKNKLTETSKGVLLDILGGNEIDGCFDLSEDISRRVQWAWDNWEDSITKEHWTKEDWENIPLSESGKPERYTFSFLADFVENEDWSQNYDTDGLNSILHAEQ